MRSATFMAVLSFAVTAMSSPASTALAQTLPVDRPAEIMSGTCGNLGEVVTSLAHVVLTLGDPQGQTSAKPVEQSGTVVPFTLGDFLSSNHAITIQESPDQVAPLVACGEIGGAINPDGTLAVGMSGMNGSGLSGVAYFTPIDTFDNMLVTILLVSNGDDALASGDNALAGDDDDAETVGADEAAGLSKEPSGLE